MVDMALGIQISILPLEGFSALLIEKFFSNMTQ